MRWSGQRLHAGAEQAGRWQDAVETCFRPRTEPGTGNRSLLGGLRDTKKGTGLLTVWGRGLERYILKLRPRRI